MGRISEILGKERDEGKGRRWREEDVCREA